MMKQKQSAQESLPLEALYKALHEEILAFFRKRTRSPERAEDLAQETFLKLLGRLEGDEPVANAEAYLFRSARNLLIDHYRTERQTAPPPDIPDDSLESSGDEEVRLEIAGWMRRFVGYLPEPYRTTLLLGDIEGVRYAEIARRMGVTEGTVKSRVHRGRKLLRKELISCCSFAYDVRGRVVDYEPLRRASVARRRRPAAADRSECSTCG